MPNHIQNRLEIIGSPLEVIAVRQYLSSIEQDGKVKRGAAINFHAIVEIPQAIECLPQLPKNVAVAVRKKYSLPYPTEPHEALMEKINRENQTFEFKFSKENEYFLQACHSYETTGYYSKLDWVISNWGVRWNAYETPDSRDTQTIIYWQTPGNHVMNLIKRVSKLFSTVGFGYAWSEEIPGMNFGQCDIIKGEVSRMYTLNAEQSFQLFLELWPEEKVNYTFDGINYVNIA